MQRTYNCIITDFTCSNQTQDFHQCFFQNAAIGKLDKQDLNNNKKDLISKLYGDRLRQMFPS